MHTQPPHANEILEHPEHGELPARRVLECVFALSPAGRILHFHLEQLDVEESPAGMRYTLTAAPPHAERTRCQIIPPFVTAFRRPS